MKKLLLYLTILLGLSCESKKSIEPSSSQEDSHEKIIGFYNGKRIHSSYFFDQNAPNTIILDTVDTIIEVKKITDSTISINGNVYIPSKAKYAGYCSSSDLYYYSWPTYRPFYATFCIEKDSLFLIENNSSSPTGFGEYWNFKGIKVK